MSLSDGTAGSAVTKTVLLVEDNPTNVLLVERIVAKRPHITLLVATRGRDGIEMARQHRPDLILLDRNLPDLNGDAVLDELQADERTRDVAVVMVSADASAEHADRARGAGAAGYLTKPFQIVELLALIDAHAASAATTAPVMAGAPDGTVDATIIEQLRGLGGLEDLVDTLAQVSADGIADLRRAVSEGDQGRAAAALHSLKGGAGSLGAADVARRAAALEGAVASLGIAALAAGLDDLAGAVETGVAAVRSALLGDPG